MCIHLDCNSFFVSCELISRPELRGTPVVVANDNGKNQIHFAVQGGESDTEDDPEGFMRAKKVE